MHILISWVRVGNSNSFIILIKYTYWALPSYLWWQEDKTGEAPLLLVHVKNRCHQSLAEPRGDGGVSSCPRRREYWRTTSRETNSFRRYLRSNRASSNNITNSSRKLRRESSYLVEKLDNFGGSLYIDAYTVMVKAWWLILWVPELSSVSGWGWGGEIPGQCSG